MRHKSQFLAITTILSLLIGLFLVAGCSDNSGQATNSSSAAIEQFSAAGGIRPEIAENNINAANQRVAANTGGTVNIPVSGGYGAVLDVPLGAISSDTTITATVETIKMKGQSALQFSFEPDGLVFSNSAVLTIDARAFRQNGIEYVDWYYFNPEKNSWEYVDRYAVSGGKIVIKLPHFSKWLGISQGGQ